MTTTQQTDAGMSRLLARFAADAHAGGELGGGDAGAGALAGLSLAGRIEAHLGTIGRELTRERARKAAELDRRMRAVAPVWLPPVSYKPAAGVLALDATRATSAGETSPQDGYAWFLTHLVVAGLAGAPANASASAMGTATNPGAGATIVSLGGAALTAIAPNGGTFNVSWAASLQGTIAAGDANNMRLTSPLGVTQELGLFPGVAGNYPQVPDQVTVAAGSGINVQAIAAASGASAVYGAQIVATLASQAGDSAQLYKVGPQLNNYLHTFTAANPDWALSSSSVFLLPDDYLVLAGTGVAASQVVLSGQAVQVALPLLADYLL